MFGQNSEVVASLKASLKILHGCTFGQLGDEVAGSNDKAMMRKALMKIKAIQ